MNFWDERYSEADFAYGVEPNDFLVEHAARIPLGPVLCLAEGQGRNAVYLAKLGHRVTALDQSAVGLARARQLAERNEVEVETLRADLAELELRPNHWHGVVSVAVHVPRKIRERVHRQVVRGLIAGGVYILEGYTERQVDMPGLGGPPPEQRHLFLSLAELRSELEGLHLEVAREVERHVSEGKYHQGLSAVVQIVAVKRR